MTPLSSALTVMSWSASTAPISRTVDAKSEGCTSTTSTLTVLRYASSAGESWAGSSATPVPHAVAVSPTAPRARIVHRQP